ncbi:hypothetical protein FOVG_16872 [Fusarium oxysporum f. sp. pisi HDV247]|uniref:aldehyde dehydrogenase (NAD(+)) n=1 Tax=Fusarium oxysporum f. sp. pisi HDV247 TaxID=1080344 RepID=W9NME3_FUSOX|nr:hypothetical protein FOVG_16872 [Fusarium oxysporum f. sp. pisi HDV247]WKT50537.1 hypothetical protein QSH57_015485 [Fusarium oxysporum f. sp. vasinfectum]
MSRKAMTAPTSTKYETRLFINGEFSAASDGGTFPLNSPLTRETVALVSEATVKDTNRAVAAAKAASLAWAGLSVHERGAYMNNLASLIAESEKELASLEAVSMGRPISGYWDAKAAVKKLQYFATAGWNGQGRTSLNTPGFVNLTLRQPFGVVAAIIPWNVPVYVFINKIAPAIAAGNTVVLKSSEKAPLTSAKLAGLIQKAGFPPGVINVLSGHGHISGATLASHMDVRLITFTGSGRTGRLIREAATKSNMKNVVLELGGKTPAVIFDDADLERAAKETFHSIQWNSGQACMANSRVYVHASVAERFLALFKECAKDVRLGDPLNPEVNHGPQADIAQYDIVKKYFEMGNQDGKLVLGGVPEDTAGYFIQPTIFVETPESARIMRDEVFGPIVNINIFTDEDEVIRMANDTEFGLYSAIYTRDIDRAMRFARASEAGTVAINCTSPTGAFDLPFGGYKASGIAREGIHDSLDNYLETKTVIIRTG